MNTAQITSQRTIGYVLFDLLALTFIYFVPTISHMLSFPLYLIEPMRIALILALAHTTKRNAYILALTLPIFSYLVSAHPVFYKMLLISGELVLNVWIFYILLARTKNVFVSLISSIVASKALYYAAKFVAVGLILKSGESIVSTSLYIQGATTIVFSVYLWLILKRRES